MVPYLVHMHVRLQMGTVIYEHKSAKCKCTNECVSAKRNPSVRADIVIHTYFVFDMLEVLLTKNEHESSV